MENDRLNEIRELNPDYDISMHKLDVCVGDSQYRLVYCIYVLKNLRKYKGVNWSQLLEVGIDNADDLYWWYVTFSIDTTAV